MSRWTSKQKAYNHTLWASKPKRIYLIDTDKGSFKVERDYLDYKTTIQELKKQGYNKIDISFIGYNVTF